MDVTGTSWTERREPDLESPLPTDLRRVGVAGLRRMDSGIGSGPVAMVTRGLGAGGASSRMPEDHSGA